MIRTLTLVDAVALPWFSHRAGQNEAWPRGRVLAPQSRFQELVHAWFHCLPGGRKSRTWVCTQGGHIRAIVTLRCRSGPRAWEAEQLIVDPCAQDLCQELLERLGIVAGQHGAATVFLRLAAESPLVETSQKAGFQCYQRASLLMARHPTPRSDGLEPGSRLRPKRSADDHALFRLYNACTPPEVRLAQGLTMQDWQEARERPNGHAVDLVLEREMTVVGWTRLAERGKAGCIELAVLREASASYPGLLDWALRELASKRAVFGLLPHYSGDARKAWEERGFEVAGEFLDLVRPVAARVREPQMIPVGA